MVEIMTQWPGHAAEEVERLITVPIETEMNGLPGLDVVRSISLYGLSDVRLVFKDGTDNYFARERVFEKLRDVDVPDGVSPDVAPLFSPSGLVYRYVLQSPDRSPMELKTIQDWVLSKAYKAVPGVADLSGFGGPDDAVPGRPRSDPARRRGPLGSGGRRGAGLEQRQRGRRILLRGRAVLLRARPGAAPGARGHRQRRPRRQERHARFSCRTSARSSSGTRLASDSSGSTTSTTPSKASC